MRSRVSAMALLPRSLPSLLSAALLVVAATGCAAFSSSYPRRVAAAQEAFEEGRFEEARAEFLGEALPDGTDAVLIHLEAASAALAGGHLEECTASFREAAGEIDELGDRPSISGRSGIESGASFLANDQTLPYDGEGYERMLLHAFAATAYLLEGRVEDAWVEVRRGEEVRREESRRLETELPGNVFASWLSGTLYDLAGRPDEAFVDYRRVVKGNPSFRRGRQDLLRVAAALGRDPGVDPLPGDRPGRDVEAGEGEILVLHARGLGPEKVAEEAILPTPGGLARLSVPALRHRPGPVGDLVLSSGDRPLGVTETVEDLASVAEESLRARIDWIATKATARTAGKAAATGVFATELDRQGNPELAALVWIAGSLFNLATERADLRAWRTLPEAMQGLRVAVPAGWHAVGLEVLDPGGRTLSSSAIGDVYVPEGGVQVLFVRTIGARAWVTMGWAPLGPGARPLPPEAAPASHPPSMVRREHRPRPPKPPPAPGMIDE